MSPLLYLNWLSFFALEFPENRENNREFAIFLTWFGDFQRSFMYSFQWSCNPIPCKLKQGIDPPEQGITGIIALLR
jgi:hypothetical protein